MDNNLNKTNTKSLLVCGAVASALLVSQSFKIAKLKDEKNKLNKKVDDLTVDKVNVVTKLRDVIDVNELLKTELDNIQNGDIETNHNKLITQSLRIKELEKSVANLTNIIANKNREISVKNQEISELEGEYNTFKRNYKEVISIKNTEIATLNDNIESLKSNLANNAEREEIINGLNVQLEKLQDEIKALNLRCSGQTEKIRELKNQIREKKNELESAQDELASFKSKVGEIIEGKKKEAETLKELSRTTDRVSKKINKAGGKKR